MRTTRPLATLALVALVAAGCSATTTSTPVVTLTDAEAAPGTEVDAQPATTVPPQEPSETTAPPVRELDVTIEPAGWVDVTVDTEDGVALHGKFWAGNDTALLFGHDFDNPTPGAAGQRAPQSSEVILPYAAALAREGLTVLAIDFRGHGRSEGEYDVPESQLDLAAAYRWLVEAGYDTIVMVGWVGSGTSAVVLDAESDDIAFAGIAMLFSPPQDTGLDADRVIARIDAPMLFVGSNAGQSVAWSRRLEAKAADSRGVIVFERVPSGVTFLDVLGGELAARLLEFAEGI